VLGFKLPKFATHYGGVHSSHSEYDEQREQSMADEGGASAAEYEAEADAEDEIESTKEKPQDLPKDKPQDQPKKAA
jgi:hypothetical protein